MQLLNITLDSHDYSDLATSARPSVSIVIDRVPQSFERKIGELSDDELSRLELWIKVIWKDKLEPEDTAVDLAYSAYRMRLLESLQIPPARRGPETIERYEQQLQVTMWSATASI
jgi:hypothetical protein